MKTKRKLLVIDDDADLLALLRGFFAQKGFEVFLAADGMRALDIVRQERLDVILLDIRLPAMDGLEVLRKIRVFEPHVPVLVITGSEDLDLAKQVLASGANDYITKPLDMSYLQYVAGVFAQAAPGPGFFPLKGIL